VSLVSSVLSQSLQYAART